MIKVMTTDIPTKDKVGLGKSSQEMITIEEIIEDLTKEKKERDIIIITMMMENIGLNMYNTGLR